MADVNYLLAVSKAGKVIKKYFVHTLSLIAAIRKKFPGCEVEAFDVSEYGMSFKDTPTIIADGEYYYKVRCEETGEVWQSTKECAKAIGVPYKTLNSAINRYSVLRGRHYVKITKNLS